MAKKKAVEESTNKSELVRQLLGQGITKPREIIAKAKEMGVEVKQGLVAQVKAQMKKATPSAGTDMSNGSIDIEKATMEFVLMGAGGSVAEAKKQIQALVDNPASKFALSVGGAEKALAQLAALERRMK